MKRILLSAALLFGGQQTPQPIPVPIQSAPFTLGYGQTISLTLAVTPKTVQAPIPGAAGYPYVADGVYVLTFDVSNQLSVYPGYYTVEIDFGSQELCEASGWGTQNWNHITIICPSPGYIIIDRSLTDTDASGPVQSSYPLVIHFTGGGWPNSFNNEALAFTPNQGG